MGTFFNGNSDMDLYIDLLATQMVATGVWSEPDAGFYPAGAHPAKRVVFDGTVYVFLERNILNGNSNGAGASATNGTGLARWNEIRVSFGTGYSLITHLLTGTTQICGVPLEGWQKTSAGNAFFLNNDVGNGNKPLQHFTWVDSAGGITGVIVAGGSAQTYDYICHFTLDRVAIKQYADGFSTLYWVCYPAHDVELNNSSVNSNARYFGKLPYDQFTSLPLFNGDGSAGTIGSVGGGGNPQRPVYFHPFNGAPTYDEPCFLGMALSGASGQWIRGIWVHSVNPPISTGRYPGIEAFFPAHRSQGDSKAYFQFPWYSANSDPVRRSLIAQTALWFDIGDTSYGLNDSDIVDYTTPAFLLQRYLCKRLPTQEATGGGSLDVAIRFA